jgi:hypothetical protein
VSACSTRGVLASPASVEVVEHGVSGKSSEIFLVCEANCATVGCMRGANFVPGCTCCVCVYRGALASPAGFDVVEH